MLKVADLAARPDMVFGAVTISPSRRIVSGPTGSASLEPRIIQVLLLLLDAKGAVVTRNQIFDECWGGVMVGDDSINRAIGRLRRVATEVAPGAFEIETIPRTGYRLVGEAFAPSVEAEATPASVDRRTMLGAAAAGMVAIAGTATWWFNRDGTDPRVTARIGDAERILREAWPEEQARGVTELREAVRLDPTNARAWGLLAVALRNVAEESLPERTSDAVRDCQSAANRALQLDPREGNALAALATLRPYFGEWGAAEDRMRSVLKVSPDNPTALSHLITLTQSVGSAAESWRLNERALRIEPLSPVHHFRRALKFWIYGRIPEADLAIDRALQLWPRHPAVWSARMYIFSFTGRADAAMRMLDQEALQPKTLRPAARERWRAWLKAVQTRAPADLAAARELNLRGAPGGNVMSMLMFLSYLGDLDTAFSVADGFLLRRGPLVSSLWPDSSQMRVNDQQWRRTMNLFTPATTAMRKDPRFRGLAEGIGLAAYWRARGGPDPMFQLA